MTDFMAPFGKKKKHNSSPKYRYNYWTSEKVPVAIAINYYSAFRVDHPLDFAFQDMFLCQQQFFRGREERIDIARAKVF